MRGINKPNKGGLRKIRYKMMGLKRGRTGGRPLSPEGAYVNPGSGVGGIKLEKKYLKNFNSQKLA